MNKIKTWVNQNPKQRRLRISFLYLLIAFVIGLTMKIVASSLATVKYINFLDNKNTTTLMVDGRIPVNHSLYGPGNMGVIGANAEYVQGATDSP